MKKWLSTLLIVLGIGIAAYPFVSKMYYDYWNQKLLDEFERDFTLALETSESAQSDFLALDSIFNDGFDEAYEDLIIVDGFDDFDQIGEDVEEIDESEPVEAAQPVVTQPALPVIGQLIIPKIDVKMAILEGASERNLNRGAARIAGTSGFGEVGNVGIAGHRGRSYGLMLNRLDEIQVDDIIEIKTKNAHFKYQVYKVHIVEPTDVTVLYRSSTHKVLTLVTCDPVVNPTHRLIVHAVQLP